MAKLGNNEAGNHRSHKSPNFHHQAKSEHKRKDLTLPKQHQRLENMAPPLKTRNPFDQGTLATPQRQRHT